MIDENSVLYALYYGNIAPWEWQVQSKRYRQQAKKALGLQEKVLALLDDDGKKLLDDFLDENSKLTCYFEEEKFKDGFILGARLMIETLQDTRFFKRGRE